MKKNKNYQTLPLLIVSIVFSVIGIAMLVAAITYSVKLNGYEKNYIEVSGKVIETDDTPTETTYSYIYNGKTYYSSASFYSSSIKRGDEVVVYINPSDINDTVLRKEITGFKLIFYIIGGTFTAVGVGLLISRVVIVSKNKKIIKTGKKITANIVEEKVNYYYRVNSRHPYNLYAEKNGKRYKSGIYFKSIFEKENKEYVVDIYYKDDKHYFVDLTTVREKSEYADDAYDEDQYEINFEKY